MSKALFSGGAEFDAALERIVVDAEKAGADGALEAAHIVEGKAKDRASGRPGPRVRSGSHRRSFHVEGPRSDDGRVAVDVGPAMIYSRRLELGFAGADSKGRIYKQPAYPSLGPGLEDAMPDIERLFVKVWTEATTLG